MPTSKLVRPAKAKVHPHSCMAYPDQIHHRLMVIMMTFIRDIYQSIYIYIYRSYTCQLIRINGNSRKEHGPPRSLATVTYRSRYTDASMLGSATWKQTIARSATKFIFPARLFLLNIYYIFVHEKNPCWDSISAENQWLTSALSNC